MTYSILPGMTSKCDYFLKGQFDILYVEVLALLDRIKGVVLIHSSFSAKAAYECR